MMNQKNFKNKQNADKIYKNSIDCFRKVINYCLTNLFVQNNFIFKQFRQLKMKAFSRFTKVYLQAI